MTAPAPSPPAAFGVFVRTWQNGRMVDEQLVCQTATFEEATVVSRRLTDRRVSLNNEDLTTAIVPLPPRQA